MHYLAQLGLPMDVVEGLPGGFVDHWDARVRHLPDHQRLIRLNDTGRCGPYLAAVCHGLPDLIAIKHLDVPRVLVLHADLQGRMVQEGCSLSLKDMQYTVRAYLRMVGGVAVATSRRNLVSWGVEGRIIEMPASLDHVKDVRWTIRQMPTDPEPSATMAEEGRRKVHDRFSEAQFVERWRAAIHEARDRHRQLFQRSSALAH